MLIRRTDRRSRPDEYRVALDARRCAEMLTGARARTWSSRSGCRDLGSGFDRRAVLPRMPAPRILDTADEVWEHGPR